MDLRFLNNSVENSHFKMEIISSEVSPLKKPLYDHPNFIGRLLVNLSPQGFPNAP